MVADDGATMSIIIDTDGRSWKLYASIQRPGEEKPMLSDWWAFLSAERAEKFLVTKVNEAETKGWHRA